MDGHNVPLSARRMAGAIGAEVGGTMLRPEFTCRFSREPGSIALRPA